MGSPGSRAWNVRACTGSVDSAAFVIRLAICGGDDVAFSMSGQDRHAKVKISELNSWPTFPLADATPRMSPSAAYGSRPERLARSSL